MKYYYKFYWEAKLTEGYWAYMYVVDQAGNFIEHPANWVDTKITSIKQLQDRMLLP